MKILLLTAFVLLDFVLVSQTQTKHTIGEKFGGGIVFYVSSDSLHGVIAETKVQGKCKFNKALELIANPENHSETGKAFTDWRLPTSLEVYFIYQHKNIVDAKKMYWSSTEKMDAMLGTNV